MNRLIQTVLLTGLLVGVLDILAAFTSSYISFGIGPQRVLQFIAAGAFGMLAAISGGWKMAGYGLLFHFLIAFSWTILFFLVYPQIKMILRNVIITGILYGLFIWFVMNLAVLPITKLPQGHYKIKSTIVGMVILIAAIGIPVSLSARRYYLKR
jgi:hypothetical protein